MRIEPTRLEETSDAVADIIAELSEAAATLAGALPVHATATLASFMRTMNAYYSNLIEGHVTRPRDIERALGGDFDSEPGRRNLQLEAASHVRVQTEIDRMAAEGRLPEPASQDFIRWLHRAFYEGAPSVMLSIGTADQNLVMTPGEWRSDSSHDVAVGRHLPPSSEAVPTFMAYFADRFRLEALGKAARLIAMAVAHHRFAYVHPFLDGNGRVGRLMSHAMAHHANIGAGGLWSVSRGLARGLESRHEYKMMLDRADMPRQGDLDGRGNLSHRALQGFVLWFLRVALDQVRFMSSLLQAETLAGRLRSLVDRDESLRPEAAQLLEAALVRKEIRRGDVAGITGLPARTARRVLNDVLAAGYLGSDSPKGALSLRIPVPAIDILFPRLVAEA